MNSRNKGSTFERLVAKRIFDSCGIQLKRNLEQYRADSQADLVGEIEWSIECKHYRSGANPKREWWEQVLAAGKAAGKEPVLVYRFNRQPIMAAVRLEFLRPGLGDQWAAMPLESWLHLLPRCQS